MRQYKQRSTKEEVSASAAKDEDEYDEEDEEGETAEQAPKENWKDLLAR